MERKEPGLRDYVSRQRQHEIRAAAQSQTLQPGPNYNIRAAAQATNAATRAEMELFDTHFVWFG